MRFYIHLTMIVVLISCGKEEFASIKQSARSDITLTFSSSEEVCANHTLVKPYVDFLFLWDNSSSQTFVNSATKEALANTISLISQRFDYRILLAPMLANNNEHAFILSATNSGLSAYAKSMVVDMDGAYSKLLAFPKTTQSQENGIERSVELINYNLNQKNGIFRKDSYLIIVLMSNGNDQINNSQGIYNGAATNSYIKENYDKIINLSSNENLNTIYTRFISLVAHSDCAAGWRIGESYKKFSNLIHSRFFDCEGNDSQDIQCSSETPDSHNICKISFNSLFDAVNDSIMETVIKHKYNYWPISMQKDPINFDLTTLQVIKSNGEEFFEVSESSGQNLSGWKYMGWRDNQPTTYEPNVGEQKNAYFIELIGDAKVTYPECLILKYDSPTYHYGYLALPHQPLVSSIVIKDGETIVPNEKWTYMGYREKHNMRVQGQNNPDFPFQEFFPADIKDGKYIIRLDESLIYSNDQKSRFTIIYDTTTN